MRGERNLWMVSKASVADLALYVSHWTAAKPGRATAALWTVPRRLNRYLREMANAYEPTMHLEELRALWGAPTTHHFTMGGKLIK